MREKPRVPFIPMVPIIHNEEVVRDLEEKGVRVLDTEEDLKTFQKDRELWSSALTGSAVTFMIF